ncbi:MAG TPA: hypothetical protein VG167_04800 [Verrucomicrobiae bacterium]|nr:hypothetical protein [Verrucomicrobiae bacterium]
MKTGILIAFAGMVAAQVQAQSILFDFNNAPVYTPLPISLTVGGVTAHFSATGGGYSIQSVTTATVVPVGFTGNFIFPSTIYASDLLVSFSTNLTQFSIQYAPEELACDSSATMRVTAYLGNTFVGTATTNAVAGTWPVQTLGFESGQQFNNVVVHYDAAPVTGGDYGPIFIADNMSITPIPPPIVLDQPVRLPNGAFQLTFTAGLGGTFIVLASTNLTSSSWTPLGTATETSPGQYQFTDTGAINPSKFYRVR